MQDAKKMSEKGKTCGKERKGLLGKNNRNDNAALNIYPHLDALGLTRCGASSEERGLKASTAFGSERILKIAAQKIIIG